jgi:hypothetical protein
MYAEVEETYECNGYKTKGTKTEIRALCEKCVEKELSKRRKKK